MDLVVIYQTLAKENLLRKKNDCMLRYWMPDAGIRGTERAKGRISRSVSKPVKQDHWKSQTNQDETMF